MVENVYTDDVAINLSQERVVYEDNKEFIEVSKKNGNA